MSVGNSTAPDCAWCGQVLGAVTNDPTAPTGVRDLGEVESGIVKCILNVLTYNKEAPKAPPKEEVKVCYFCSPLCASEAAAHAAVAGGINSEVGG